MGSHLFDKDKETINYVNDIIITRKWFFSHASKISLTLLLSRTFYFGSTGVGVNILHWRTKNSLQERLLKVDDVTVPMCSLCRVKYSQRPFHCFMPKKKKVSDNVTTLSSRVISTFVSNMFANGYQNWLINVLVM